MRRTIIEKTWKTKEKDEQMNYDDEQKGKIRATGGKRTRIKRDEEESKKLINKNMKSEKQIQKKENVKEGEPKILKTLNEEEKE